MRFNVRRAFTTHCPRSRRRLRPWADLEPASMSLHFLHCSPSGVSFLIIVMERVTDAGAAAVAKPRRARPDDRAEAKDGGGGAEVMTFK